MNVDGLESFVKIAELQSLSAAAKLYGLPKSTLSLHVKQLEAQLGTALFIRDGRAMALTEAGQTLRAHALDILERCEMARVAVAETLDDAAGTLRIGATGEFGTAFYSQMLYAFRQRYPKVQLELTFFSPHALYVPGRLEMLDAIISWDEGNADVGPVEHLWSDRFALFASRTYIEKHGSPASVDELDQHQGVLFRTPSGLQTWRLQNGSEQTSILPRSELIANDYWTVKYFAVAGEGIAYLPKFFTAIECERGHLLPLMPDWASAAQRVTLRITRPSAKSRRMDAFLGFCREYFSPGFVFGGPRYFVETVLNPTVNELETDHAKA